MPPRFVPGPLLRRALLPIVVAGLELTGPDSPLATTRQKQVLVLHSTRRDAQIAVIAERELPRILGASQRQSVDYYSEFIDPARFRDAGYEAAFRDFMLLKYRGQRFDVVIAMSNGAVDFVGSNRNTLFSRTPVVALMDREARRIPNGTGLVTQVDLSATVTFAAALQPDIRNVFVVSGADLGDKDVEDLARIQLRPLEPHFTFTYLTGLPTADLVKRLAKLPPHSIVYYLIVSQDGAGEYFHPLEYIDRVARAANAPTYCWVDSAMDHGIVGGSLRDQKLVVDAVAVLAARVLRGEQADGIALSSLTANVNQVDWRQLQRWGLREARIPQGTVVKFRESSLWESYRLQVVVAVVLLLAQTGLIVTLLMERTIRRRAENELRGSRAALRASYERIRELGRRLLNAQEVERARIARELHDDVGQQLALLAIDLELTGGFALDEPPAPSRDLLGHVHGLVKSVHDLSHRLHPAKLQLLGLVAALGDLEREFKRPDLTIDFTHENVPATLPSETTVCLFRIAQEALQNVVKHSGACHVWMRLIGNDHDLILTVADDGAGFDVAAARRTGIGLVSMAERAEAIGGRLTVRTKSGAGTQLQIAVPLYAQQSAFVETR